MSIEGKRLNLILYKYLSKGFDKGVMTWKVYRMKNLEARGWED